MSQLSVLTPGRWRDFFPQHQLVHRTLMATIVIGFFLAPIKDRYPSPLSYFLFDLGLALTILFWLTGTDRLRRWTLPRTPLTLPLLLFYVVCFAYMFISEMPLWAGLSAWRGWCVASVAFLLGYDLVQSSQQVRFYLWLVIGLSVISGVYGLYQYAAGIESVIGSDTLVMQRHQFVTYATEEGEVEFRIFSTFTSAGAFGTMMGYAGLIALALLTGRRVGSAGKMLLGLALIPMLISLVLTGARGAVVTMLIGVAILCVYRRRIRIYMVMMVLLVVGARFGVELTEGRAMKRLATLTDPQILWGRLSNPLRTGWEAILQAPLGKGLGVTGHGIPFFLLQQHPDLRLVFSDGDFGRVMVEMGVVGLVLLGLILGMALKGAAGAVRMLRGAPDEDVALAIMVSSAMVAAGTLVGSPFLGIPHGLLWWLFMGALFRLQVRWSWRHPQPGPESRPRSSFRRRVPLRPEVSRL